MNPAAPDTLLSLTFDAASRSHAGEVAFFDGTKSVSYKELSDQTRIYAARIRASLDTTDRHGSRDGHGVLVGLLALDPVATIAWMFGALSTGASVVVIEPNGRDAAAQLRLLQPDVIVACNGATVIDIRRNHVATRQVAPEIRPPGVIVCTAGTTGEPKAVVHSHATLGHAVRRLQLFRLEAAGAPGRVPADEHELARDLLDAAGAPAIGLRYASTLPLTTMAGLTVTLQALLAGDALSLPPTADPSALLDRIAATGVTNLSLTPLLAQLVLRAARQQAAPRLRHLMFVGIGGGPAGPTLPAELEEALGCPVAVGYGMTESGGAIAMGRITDPPAVRHGTVGRPLPGVELDIDTVSQELTVRSASIAIGYITRDHTLEPIGHGRLRTGDLARSQPDGTIELWGRVDALILRGGRNIDPVRIERALEGHPAVRRAAAFGVSNRLVSGEQDIWTAVVLDHDATEPELRAHCNRSLGASLTPRRVIAVDALPLTADGSVRRHELIRLADRRSKLRTRSS
jgi:acyl-CoA synthetase (AMP-forming)/AMP-acid ligase II